MAPATPTRVSHLTFLADVRPKVLHCGVPTQSCHRMPQLHPLRRLNLRHRSQLRQNVQRGLGNRQGDHFRPAQQAHRILRHFPRWHSGCYLPMGWDFPVWRGQAVQIRRELHVGEAGSALPQKPVHPCHQSRPFTRHWRGRPRGYSPTLR